MDADLRLLTVHAHPDDESSKGAGTVAKYHDDGVRCVLVCCTGGEAGSILNPAMDRPEVKADIATVRRDELALAASIIGYDEVVWLGYRDSGMPDSEENADPRSFAQADLGEAVGRLVAVIRRERPQVIVTYPDEQSRYPHPDHLRVHEISDIAFDAAADPDQYPELGEPWQASKLYYTMWARERVEAMHRKLLELGLESPFDEKWFEGPSQDERITTRVDISGFYDRRKRALIAHATQVDPNSPFWFALPDDVAADLYPWEDYTLARSLVDATLPSRSRPISASTGAALSDGGSITAPEDDLFAGVRELVAGRSR